MLSILFFGIFFFLIFSSFLKLNPKSQTTMDGHRHKIFIILVFFTAISHVEKIETLSITHKQTNNEAPQKGEENEER